jgi:glucose-6-phosphate 1-dehydrogenase
MFEFSELPQRRAAALKTLFPDMDSAVRAQYEGYAKEVNNSGSQTETLVSLLLKSNAPRWENVPIRLTTGKNLNDKLTEIRVYFNKTDETEANLLTLRVQPHEGIELKLWVKKPGYDRALQELPLHFNYDQHFERLPEAYEQVIFDAMRSNHSLFASSEEVLASWEILQPIQTKWAMESSELLTYKPGSTINEVLMAAKNRP